MYLKYLFFFVCITHGTLYSMDLDSSTLNVANKLGLTSHQKNEDETIINISHAHSLLSDDEYTCLMHKAHTLLAKSNIKPYKAEKFIQNFSSEQIQLLQPHLIQSMTKNKLSIEQDTFESTFLSALTQQQQYKKDKLKIKRKELNQIKKIAEKQAKLTKENIETTKNIAATTDKNVKDYNKKYGRYVAFIALSTLFTGVNTALAAATLYYVQNP